MWRKLFRCRNKRIVWSKLNLNVSRHCNIIPFEHCNLICYYCRREANPESNGTKGKKRGKKGKSSNQRKPKGGRGQRAPGKKLSIGRKRR